MWADVLIPRPGKIGVTNDADAGLWWELIPLSFGCVWQSNLPMAGMSVPAVSRPSEQTLIKTNIPALEAQTRAGIPGVFTPEKWVISKDNQIREIHIR